MFGDGYRDMEFYDVIEMEDVNIGSYLDDDPENIVFVVKEGPDSPPVLFGSSRSQVRSKMAIYDCAVETNRYLSMNALGYHGVAVMSYEAAKVAILKSNYQIFALRRAGTTDKLISHEVRHLEGSLIGALHCQDGSESPYYQIHVPPYYG